MKIVNGYPCRTCADESLARRGIDPARPEEAQGILSPAEEARRARLQTYAAPDGINRPLATGDRGRIINLLA